MSRPRLVCGAWAQLVDLGDRGTENPPCSAALQPCVNVSIEGTTAMLDKIKDRLSVRREPIAYLAVAVVAALGGYQVLVEGSSVADVLGDNYLEGLIAALTAGLARASVYSPKTVEDAEEE